MTVRGTRFWFRHPLFLALLAALLIPSPASAAPPQDSVTGSGRVVGQSGAASDFSVSAHSGALGENPRGNLNFRRVDFPGEPDKGSSRVLCLQVNGNQAAIVAEFKKDSPFPGFPFAALYVEDNGQPSDPTPDRGVAFGFSAAVDCTVVFGFAGFAQPLLQGNVVVRDASAIP